MKFPNTPILFCYKIQTIRLPHNVIHFVSISIDLLLLVWWLKTLWWDSNVILLTYKEARNLNFLYKKKIYIFLVFFFIVIRKQKRSGPPGGSVLRPFFPFILLTFTVLFFVCVCVLLCGLSALYIARACATPSIRLAFFFYYYSSSSSSLPGSHSKKEKKGRSERDTYTTSFLIYIDTPSSRLLLLPLLQYFVSSRVRLGDMPTVQWTKRGKKKIWIIHRAGNINNNNNNPGDAGSTARWSQVDSNTSEEEQEGIKEMKEK